MTSSEDDGGTHSSAAAKKRRLQRACDVCRRKKRRCNGAPGRPCSICMEANAPCTFDQPAKKRGPPRQYLNDVQSRLDKMESLLARLHPDTDFSEELGAATTSRASTRDTPSQESTPSDNESAESADDEPSQSISERLESMRLDPLARLFPSHGRPTGGTILQTILSVRQDVRGDVPRLKTKCRRPEFWIRPEWETKKHHVLASDYVLPEPDLLSTLLDAYWTVYTLYGPVLHRPTFERKLEEGLHLYNEEFAAVLLVVCAIASRYVDDPRVLLEGQTTRRSAGWKWYNQVQIVRDTVLVPSLYELQRYALAVFFLHGSAMPRSVWTVIGVGIRTAIDAGAHRKESYRSQPSVDEELWKRAFWVLVCADSSAAAQLQRPRAIQLDEITADVPLEVDDEYWEPTDGTEPFKQPAHISSYVSHRTHQIELHKLKSFVIDGLANGRWKKDYSSTEAFVDEFDRRSYEWLQSLPQHLRWDASNPSDLFLGQSVLLHAMLYTQQITVHRQFIMRNERTPLMLRHLVACTTAARTGITVCESLHKRLPHLRGLLASSIFHYGAASILNMWAAKRGGLRLDIDTQMADVQRCLTMLKAGEDMVPLSGRFWDRLNEVLTTCEGQIPEIVPIGSQAKKRGRSASEGEGEGVSPSPGSAASTPLSSSSSLSVAGSMSTASAQPAGIQPVHWDWGTASALGASSSRAESDVSAWQGSGANGAQDYDASAGLRNELAQHVPSGAYASLAAVGLSAADPVAFGQPPGHATGLYDGLSMYDANFGGGMIRDEDMLTMWDNPLGIGSEGFDNVYDWEAFASGFAGSGEVAQPEPYGLHSAEHTR